MAGVIGDTLPLGLGIALNPIVIVVVILILATGEGRKNGLAVTIGWVTGLTAILLLVALLTQRESAADPQGTQVLVAAAKIIFGGTLIAAAIRTLFHRPPPGVEPAPPRWMRMVDNAGFARSLGLGLFLSVISIKNLALGAAAAGIIGQSGLGTRGVVIAVAIFVLVSSTGVLVPVLIHLVGGESGAATLDTWRTWLNVHMGAITAVVMLVLGVHLIGKGVGALF